MPNALRYALRLAGAGFSLHRMPRGERGVWGKAPRIPDKLIAGIRISVGGGKEKTLFGVAAPLRVVGQSVKGTNSVYSTYTLASSRQ